MSTPDPPSGRRAAIPPDVDELVLRALAKKPEGRFASMEAFAAEIARVRRAAAERPTVTYPPPRPSRPRAETVALPETQEEVRRATLRTRRRARAAGVVLAAVAVAVLGGAWLVAERTRAARTAVATATSLPTATSTPTSPPTATATSTPTSPPTATATATPTSTPDTDAPVRAPALVEETSVAVAPPAPVPEGPARPKKAARRSGPLQEPAAREDLKDPYSGGGDLKDPFE